MLRYLGALAVGLAMTALSANKAEAQCDGQCTAGYSQNGTFQGWGCTEGKSPYAGTMCLARPSRCEYVTCAITSVTTAGGEFLALARECDDPEVSLAGATRALVVEIQPLEAPADPARRRAVENEPLTQRGDSRESGAD